MALLSESDYTHVIQALEFYIESKLVMSAQEEMEKQALLCWVKMGKSKLSS